MNELNESIKQKLHELELKDLKIQELECERERIKNELEYVRETTRNLMEMKTSLLHIQELKEEQKLVEMKLKLAHNENSSEDTSEQ